MDFKTYYPWLAGAMFFLLLIENFISEKNKVTK